MSIETYHSPFSVRKIMGILAEQIDPMPGLLRCILTLNSARYIGASKVCGTLAGSAFELRNRKDPFLSIRAQGTLKADKAGTIIEIRWVKPKAQDYIGAIFLRRYSYDKDTILGFLREQLSMGR